MKKSFRFLTLITALALLLSLCLPVLAAEDLTAAASPVKLTIRAVRDGYTKKITKDIVIKALPGTAVSITPRTVKGYTFQQVVDSATNTAVNPASYTAPAADTVLYAKYLKHQKLTIKYVYASGSKTKNAAKATTMTLCPGEAYTVTPKEIKGYTYLETKDPNNGVAPQSASTVMVYYAKNVTATVKFMLDGKKKKVLADPAKISGLSGQSYDVNSVIPTLSGYQVSSVSDPNKGVFGVKNHTITVKFTASSTPQPGSSEVVVPGTAAPGTPVTISCYVIYAESGGTLASSSGQAVSGVLSAMPVPSLNGLSVDVITINGVSVPTNTTTYTPNGNTEIIWYVRSPGQGTVSLVNYDRTDGPMVDTSSEAEYLLQCINVQRSYSGLPALTIDKTLNWCASVRAQESAIVSLEYYYNHQRPDGRSCFTVHPMVKGENLGAYSGTGMSATDHLMQLWMNSPAHRANILDGTFKTIGLYVYVSPDGTSYWAQEFGY